MALFRSNRGMHLLTLPTAHADAENTRRKNIQDGGTTTASRLLAQARVRRRWSAARRAGSFRWWSPCSDRAADPSCSSAPPGT